MKIVSAFFIMIFCLLQYNIVLAQSTGVEESFTITKDKNLSLPAIERSFFTTPHNLIPERGISKVDFESIEIRPALNIDLPPYLVRSLAPEFNELMHHDHHLLLGFGTRLNSLLKYSLNKEYVKDKSISLNAMHHGLQRGPILDEKSAENGQSLHLQWKQEKKAQQLKIGSVVNRFQYQYFGLPDSLQSDQNRLNEITPQTRWNVKTNIAFDQSWKDFTTTVDASHQFTNLQFTGSNENWININSSLFWHIQGNLRLDLVVDLDQVNFNDQISTARTILQPSIRSRFIVDDWIIRAGFKFALGDQYSFAQDNLRFYPDFRISRSWDNNGYLEISYSGHMSPHTLASLTQQNVYVGSTLDIRTQNNQTQVGAKYHQNISEKVNLEIFGSYSTEQNRPFFVNESGSLSQFSVIYDQGTTGLFQFGGRFRGEVVEGLQYGVLLQFNQYFMDSLDNAFHLPTFQSTISLNYQPFNKLMIATGLTYYQGIIYGTSNPLERVPDGENILNWSVKSQYKVKENVTSFISVDNLLNQSNSYYYLYRTIPRLVTFGVQLHF